MQTFDEWFAQSGWDEIFKGTARVAWKAGFDAGFSQEAALFVHDASLCPMCGEHVSACICPKVLNPLAKIKAPDDGFDPADDIFEEADPASHDGYSN